MAVADIRKAPHSWPIGESQPPGNEHAVSVSLPTWAAVIGWSRRESWVVDQMKCGYPRLYINKAIQRLAAAVLSRCGLSDAGCMVFPSAGSAGRCVEFLVSKKVSATVSTATFAFHKQLPPDWSPKDARWVEFHAVFYPKDILPEAMAFWRQTGDGMSSRHAEFSLLLLGYLESSSPIVTLRTIPSMDVASVPRALRLESAALEKYALSSLIAELATSERSEKLTSYDVFLYPKGLSAIYALSRALIANALLVKHSAVVVYGWPYAETVKCIELSGWSQFTLYGHGTQAELDELETDLASGRRISALFCELPSNPQLASPDLERIRALANKYGFIVACDETLGTFVNVDVLPYADVVMTSLTKIFSGASDVMGGSVIVNPKSLHHDSVHAALSAQHEETFFPTDIKTLARNCLDFVPRVQQTNRSAEAVANHLNNHPSVARVNYPSLVPTRHLYDRCKRRGGGYGFLMSIIFHEPDAAVRFYDHLNVAKGPSLGANFTLAIPYAQLAHFHEQDWAAEYDVPKHIVRISIGLEDKDKLMKAVARALASVEDL